MPTLFHWLEENWFSVLQGAGIIGSLLFTGISLRKDIAARRFSDLLSATAEHRELWSEVHRRSDLERILATQIDLVSRPLTTAEDEFLNIIIVHFQTGWELAKQKGSAALEEFALDARHFFSLPLPHEVWIQSRFRRNPRFVEYIDKCLASKTYRSTPRPGSCLGALLRSISPFQSRKRSRKPKRL